MTSSLAEAYFHWLEPQVRESPEHQRKTYWDVLHVMFETDFSKGRLIPNDHNRIEDAMDLRSEFLEEGQHRGHPLELGPVSVLEVLIGLSRRLAFLAGGSEEGWAWQLFNNLELHKYHDPLSRRRGEEVRDILHCLVWRTYQPDGGGGFFPLIQPETDQTEIELWYQMSAYVDEIHPEF